MTESTTLLHKKIQEHFDVDKRTTREMLNSLTLMIYQMNTPHNDLYHLAKILPEEYLIKLVNYYDGALLSMPSKIEYRDSMLLVMIFFLREIQGWSWPQIKQYLNLPDDTGMNSISLSRKLMTFNKKIRKEFLTTMKKLNVTDAAEFFKNFDKSVRNPSEEDLTNTKIASEKNTNPKKRKLKNLYGR
jgi:hypothetical protein